MLFLEGAGSGFVGAVAADGRYGWVGGTSTTAHVAPSTIGILLTQLQMTVPTRTQFMARVFGSARSEGWNAPDSQSGVTSRS